MEKLSLQNPLFATYVIAATLMILKSVSMSWLTVIRMIQVKGGFLSPVLDSLQRDCVDCDRILARKESSMMDRKIWL